MHHVLPDPEPAHIACSRSRKHTLGLSREVGSERLLAGEARRKPLHELLGNLFQEARRNVVTRLAVQHARLGMREVEAMACAGDRDVSVPSLLLQAFGL